MRTTLAVLIDVIETFEIEEVIDSGVPHTTQTYEDYLDKDKNLKDKNLLFRWLNTIMAI